MENSLEKVAVALALPPFLRAGGRYEVTWPGGERETFTLAQPGTSGWVRAASEGRDNALPDDDKAMAAPVLRHRLVLRPEADLEGVTTDHVVSDIVAAVEVPK